MQSAVLHLICFPEVINTIANTARFSNYWHCMESVQMRSFSWSVFSCIRTEYGVNLRIQSEYKKMRTRKNSVSEYFSRSVTITIYFYIIYKYII